MYDVGLPKRKEEKKTVFACLKTHVNYLSRSTLSSKNILSCSNSAFIVNLKLQKTKCNVKSDVYPVSSSKDIATTIAAVELIMRTIIVSLNLTLRNAYNPWKLLVQ